MPGKRSQHGIGMEGCPKGLVSGRRFRTFKTQKGRLNDHGDGPGKGVALAGLGWRPMGVYFRLPGGEKNNFA
jgi:hypothetical protein